MRITTDIPLCLATVKQTLGIKPSFNDYTRLVSAICTDSRELRGGELFIGLKGEKYDGSLFIPQIKNRVLCSIGAIGSGADIILKNPNASLLRIANFYKKLLPIKKTVAITGSVGKTTTKNIIFSLLEKHFTTHATYKNLNNEFGVPFTILSAPANTQLLVIEAGMNHAGELHELSLCIEPDISVITKIGTAHIGNIGSIEKIADAKCEILDGMKQEFAIIPHNDEILKSRIENYKTVSEIENGANYSFFPANNKNIYHFKTDTNAYEFTIYGLEKANFHTKRCLLFALAVCSEVNISEEQISESLKSIDFSLFSKEIEINDLTLINDSYNSSPEAVIGALDSLKCRKSGKKKSAVLGDMLELGDLSEKLHFEIGLHASKSDLENVYLIGAFSTYIYDGLRKGGFDERKIFVNEDAENPEITARQILKHSSNEVILFKASRKIKLERIIDILKKAQK